MTQSNKGRGADTLTTPTTRVDDTGSAGLIHFRDGMPVTDSLTIAREFGRSHKHVLRTLDSLIEEGSIDRPNFEPISYTDGQNRKQRMIELDERGALIAMPFVGGRNSRAGQVRLVDAFLKLRSAARSHAAAIDATNEPSSVLDRRSLYRHAADMVALRRLSFANAYRALNNYAGTTCFRDMSKRDVVAADGFADRLLAGDASRHDFDRIDSNRAELNGDTPQLSLLEDIR
ncbi:Rha family transcriptional regulator [Burkholderia sp. Ac-20353]|uniref:Rha family transcriptional regulator n=1 Tax=Burkholderia sp. Ac-20353 TaxID=2703894 RepID=UPI001F11C959|nr:Rha family transcriptional regulator [Burkholderia sp. Ac-20353]